jgi:nucleoid-associated protein YgaU
VDVYLASGETTILLPITPERFQVQTAARTQTLDRIGLGEAVFPRGNLAARISFDCFLPGEDRQNDPWVKAWRHPLEIVAILGQWKANGDVVRLLVTESQITGWDLFIERFDREESGGWGDVKYTLGLVEATTLRILTDAEEAAEAAAAAAQAAGGVADTGAPADRSEPERPASYTVTEDDAANGDSWLWLIARRFYGDGDRWADLWFANESAIEAVTGTPDSNVPAVGVELVLPD